MSESTSAPSGAPAAPAPSQGGAESSPAPNTQPSISISDAARLLGQQRRPPGAPTPAPTSPEATRRPSPNEVTRTEAAATEGDAPGKAPAREATAREAANGLSAMEKALGVPGVPGVGIEGAASPDANGADASAGVEIEGKRYSVAELREHVLKATDYTKKTQELAAQRQELEARQQALATVLPYIQPELQRLAESVRNAPQRPDPRLLDADPNRYHRERAVYEQAVEEQGRLANLTTLQQQAANRALEQQVSAANESLAKEFPFWADPQQRLEAQQQIVRWATTKGGFQEHELRGLSNPAHLKAMMKAAMFDRWVEGAKTSAPPTMAPTARGVAPPPAVTERVQAAQERFDAKPDFRSGAALLAARRAAVANGSGR